LVGRLVGFYEAGRNGMEWKKRKENRRQINLNKINAKKISHRSHNTTTKKCGFAGQS
jgi:hypothetical protein